MRDDKLHQVVLVRKVDQTLKRSKIAKRTEMANGGHPVVVCNTGLSAQHPNIVEITQKKT
jgi:hypothetical protein